MVAMFTYTVSVPPQKLEFGNSINKEWLKGEFQNLYTKGILLFTEVENFLKQIESKFVGSMLYLQGSLKEFCVIIEMLKQERAAFEVGIQNVVAKNGSPDEAFHKLLSLNRLRWELLLESYIWDKRLHSLLLPDPAVVIIGPSEKGVQEQPKLKMEGTATGGNEGQENNFQNGDKVFIDNSNLKDKAGISAESNEVLVKEIQVDGPVQSDVSERTTLGSIPNGFPNQDFSVKPVGASNHHPGDNNLQSENFLSPKNLVEEKPISNSVDLNNDFIADPNTSERGYSPRPLLAKLEKLNGWFWMPFSELQQIYMKDLHRNYVPKFKSVSSYSPELPAVCKLICDEGSRLHIPLGTDNYIVSDYEGELSSVIACALALLKDWPVSATVLNEDSRKDSEMTVKRTVITSPHWSINDSSDSDSVHSALRDSSEESCFSCFDGLNLLDSLGSQETLSPEVYIGVSKSLAKGKYSVKCLYANQFRELRSRCCPSELDYIDSLSRCKNWDAKGGKSKSFFAKTLDDRFIIKEIKKTEYGSFEKFALHYFKYVNESFDFGSQTCLAKVLGIYQVTVRQPKSGKETRHDLMVMENLTYGCNIVRRYDLKGALHARFNSVVDGSGDVLLDQNFVNDMNTSPVYVSKKAKRLLQQAVWNDTTFLTSINVMDYSLLVGVDTQRRVLVCGIIDYLRQYTWDKHLVTRVKSSLVPKNVLPTVISPKEYKKRFRKFMSTHFLSVPDQ